MVAESEVGDTAVYLADDGRVLHYSDITERGWWFADVDSWISLRDHAADAELIDLTEGNVAQRLSAQAS